MTQSAPVLNAVIAFARRYGFAVIPLGLKSKIPAVKWQRVIDGQPFTDAELKEFWDSRRHNPGVVTGEASMVIVVDADNAAAVAWVEANLPKTPWVVVTRHGKHYYYLLAPGADVRNAADVLGAKAKWAWEAKVKLGLDVHVRQTKEQSEDEFAAESERAAKAREEALSKLEMGPVIDIRGHGGQVVGPGAVHESGHVYAMEAEWPENRALVPTFDPAWFKGKKWQDPDKPQPTPLQAAAERFFRKQLESVDTPMRVKRGRAWLAKVDPAVAKMRGHDKLFYAACRLVIGFDLDTETAFNLIKDDYNPRCQPPWTDKELAHKVQDAAEVTDVERGYMLVARDGKLHNQGEYMADAADFEIAFPPGQEPCDQIPPRPDWANENVPQPPEPEDGAKVVNSAATDDEETRYWTARWAQPFGVDYAQLKANREWFSTKQEGKRWSIPPVSNNIYVVLKYSRFLNLRLRFDQLKLESRIRDGQRVDDAEVSRIKRALDHMWNGSDIPKKKVSDVVELVAMDQAYEPVQDFIRGLPPWDGVNRIDQVPHEILGTEGNDPAHALMFRHFLVGMVARIFEPGIKVDTMLFLVSRQQGTYKSSFFRYLIDGHMKGNQWFSDSYFDLKSRDGKLLIGTSILVEWSEGEHAKSAKAIDSVKAFLSQQDDDFRLPYGERIVKRPRRCVFCGTSNDEELLHDASGSRRFYIIKTGTINMQRLEEWRPLLFAEAYAQYLRHIAAPRFSPDWEATRWWFMASEDAIRQNAVAEFRARSVWYEDVANWVAKRGPERPFTTGDVIEEAIAMAKDKKDKRVEREVIGILIQLGCQRMGLGRVEGRVGRFWTAPRAPTADVGDPSLDGVL